MLIVLLFMYIFSFKIYSEDFFNSTLVLGVILIVFFMLNKNYRLIVINTILIKRILLILIFLIGITGFSALIPTIFMTYEYSIIITFLNQFITLLIGLLLFSLYIKQNKVSKLIKHLIYVFIIQSAIQMVSYFIPSVNEILNQFRFESAITRGQEGYGNLRGIAISGSAFFGLSVSYGLIYILFIINWNKIFINHTYLRYLSLVLLFFGGVSAGRTSLIGWIIGLIYLLSRLPFKRRKKGSYRGNQMKLSTLISIFILLLSSILFYFVISNNDQLITQTERLLDFGFQFITNYQNTGELYTTSTNTLFQRMYFKIDNDTLLLGDGIYTNPDGTYYMYTDAGYMRNILFFGIIGLIILFFYQLTFFVWKNKKQFYQNLLIVIYLLIVHIKGDVIGFLIITQSILFLIVLTVIYKEKSTNYLNQSIN